MNRVLFFIKKNSNSLLKEYQELKYSNYETQRNNSISVIELTLHSISFNTSCGIIAIHSIIPHVIPLHTIIYTLNDKLIFL